MPTAPASSAMDKGRMSPTCIERRAALVQPREEQRDRETRRCTRYCTDIVSPGIHLSIAEDRRPDQWLTSRAIRCASHSKKATISPPRTMRQIAGETPKTEGPPGLGMTQPHSEDRSTPYTARPSRIASVVPITSSGTRSAAEVALPSASQEQDEHDHDDLTNNIQRQEKKVVAYLPMSRDESLPPSPRRPSPAERPGRTSAGRWPPRVYYGRQIIAAPTPRRNDQPRTRIEGWGARAVEPGGRATMQPITNLFPVKHRAEARPRRP